MKLVILGKAIDDYEKKEDEEVWTVGTHTYKNANKYFEFHGLKVNHKNVTTEVPEYLKNAKELPLNNSICIMLAIACKEYNFEEIRIIGSPMLTKMEYIEQRPALAFLVGLYNGLGKNVIWEDLPKNNNYGVK